MLSVVGCHRAQPPVLGLASAPADATNDAWQRVLAGGDAREIGEVARAELYRRDARFIAARLAKKGFTQAADEREAFFKEVLAVARSRGMPELVSYVMERPEDFTEHREAVGAALDSPLPLNDQWGVAARRAFRNEPAMLAQLPCRETQTDPCVERVYGRAWLQARTAVARAARYGDRSTLIATIEAVLAHDPFDTRMRVLSAMAHDTPPDDITLFTLARDAAVTKPGPHHVAIALRGAAVFPDSMPHLLAIAELMLETNHPADTAILADRVILTDLTGTYAKLAAELSAKADLALGNAAAYITWRNKRDWQHSSALLDFEMSYRDAKAAATREVGRAALARSLTMPEETRLALPARLVTDTTLSIEVRTAAADKLMRLRPTVGVVADACLKGEELACAALQTPGEPLPFEAFLTLKDLEHVSPTWLAELHKRAALSSSELPALLDRLEQTRHKRSSQVALARLAHAIHLRDLDKAQALIDDPATTLEDADLLYGALAIADIRDWQLDDETFRYGEIRSFTQLDRGLPMQPMDAFRRGLLSQFSDELLTTRLERAELFFGTTDTVRAAALYEGLLERNLPWRARADLTARAALAAAIAGDKTRATKILDAHPDVANAYQVLAVRGYLVLDKSPKDAAAYLAVAASDLRASRHTRDALAYALVQADEDNADWRAFAYTTLDAHVDATDNPPLSDWTKPQLRDATHIAYAPEYSLVLSPAGPVVMYARSYIEDVLGTSLRNARSPNEIRLLASELYGRAPPASPAERAWLLVLANRDALAVNLLKPLEETPPSEVFLLATERAQPRSAAFDTLSVHALWLTRNDERSRDGGNKRVNFPVTSPEGEELMCRYLMRMRLPEPAIKYCLVAWQHGRKDAKIADAMSYIAVERPESIGNRGIPADTVFAEGAFEDAGYVYAFNKALWLSRQTPYDGALVASTFRDALAAYDNRSSIALHNELRAAVMANEGLLLRALFLENADDPELFKQAVLAVSTGDIAVARVAAANLPSWTTPSPTDFSSTIIRDLSDLAAYDQQNGHFDKRLGPTVVTALANAQALPITTDLTKSRSHVIMLAAAERAMIENDPNRALRITDELTKSHPKNFMVARIAVSALLKLDKLDPARARINAMGFENNDPRKLVLHEIVNKHPAASDIF